MASPTLVVHPDEVTSDLPEGMLVAHPDEVSDSPQVADIPTPAPAFQHPQPFQPHGLSIAPPAPKAPSVADAAFGQSQTNYALAPVNPAPAQPTIEQKNAEVYGAHKLAPQAQAVHLGAGHRAPTVDALAQEDRDQNHVDMESPMGAVTGVRTESPIPDAELLKIFEEQNLGHVVGGLDTVNKAIDIPSQYVGQKIEQGRAVTQKGLSGEINPELAEKYPTLYPAARAIGEATSPIGAAAESLKLAQGMITDPKNIPFLLAGGPEVRPVLKAAGTALFTIMSAMGAKDAYERGDWSSAAAQAAFGLLGITHLAPHEQVLLADRAKTAVEGDVTPESHPEAPVEAQNQAQTVTVPPDEVTTTAPVGNAAPQTVQAFEEAGTQKPSPTPPPDIQPQSPTETVHPDEVVTDRRQGRRSETSQVFLDKLYRDLRSAGTPEEKAEIQGAIDQERKMAGGQNASTIEKPVAMGEQSGGAEGFGRSRSAGVEPGEQGQEAARAQAPVGGSAPEVGKVGEMPAQQIAVDPHRFQFKQNTDAEGVSPLLKEQGKFNPDLAGVISVWKDPADGKTYVVNGHHRLELAKRTGQRSVVVRHINAADHGEARATGALQNIAEGRGTPLDAAKFMRDAQVTPEDLKAKGVSLGEATARDGLALSHLDDHIFNRAVQGEIPIKTATAIGAATPDHAEQRAILQLVEAKEKQGKRVGSDTISELVRFVKNSGQTTETTHSLFGEEQVSKSLALEKAEVSAYIKQQLAKDKKLFGFVAKEGRAVELARGGNKIDVEKNRQISTDAAQAEEVYNKLSERGGSVSSALDDAARRLANGENPNAVKQEAYNRTRQAVSETLAGGEVSGDREREADAGRRGAEVREPGRGGDASQGALDLTDPDRKVPGARSAYTGNETGNTSLQDLTESIARQMPAKTPFRARFNRGQELGSRGSLKDAVSQSLGKLQGGFAALVDAYKRPPKWTDYEDATGKWVGADQYSASGLQQFTDAVKKTVPDKLKREAISNWIEAGGDDALLRSRAEQSQAPYKAGYEAALNLSDAEQTIARNVMSRNDATLKEAQGAGLMTQGVENYVRHLYKDDPKLQQKIAAEMNFASLQVTPGFTKQRSIPTYFDAERLGFTPKDKDVGYLTAVHERSFREALAARDYIRALMQGKAKDGRPLIVTDPSTARELPATEGKKNSAYVIKPNIGPDSKYGDYRTIDHWALRGWKWVANMEGKDVMVQGNALAHPDIFRHLKNNLTPSALRNYEVRVGEKLIKPGQVALDAQANIKHAVLSFSGFHQTTLGIHGAEHRINPVLMPELDLNDPVQRKLVDHGLMVANYDAEEAFGEGVASGGIMTKIPLVGPAYHQYVNYLFRSYMPRLKMEMAQHALGRNLERYKGKMSEDEIHALTAQQANAAFGGLNYKLLGRNKTFQDVLRLTLMAPDFLEARGRFVGQAARPHGAEQAQALALGALVLYSGARVLNQMTDKKPHWDKPFSVIVGGKEYHLRTVQEDLLDAVSHPGKFAKNRLSPLASAAVNVMTDESKRGKHISAVQRIKSAASAVAPIPVQPWLRKGNESPAEKARETAFKLAGINVKKAKK